MKDLALFLQLSVQLGTPFLLATLGGIMSEKAGHLNLGIEGMMMLGSFFGFMVGIRTESPVLAVLAAAAGGAFGALIYAVITVTLKGNQTVTGFALTIFGTGFANFLGKAYSGQMMSSAVTSVLGTHKIPGFSNIPVLGTAIFSQSLFVYFSLLAAIAMWVYYQKTRPGLAVRMVGENPGAADASGIHVNLYKYIHVVLGGALCGLAGAYLSLVYVPYWQDNITAGIGWYLFGILKGMALKFQGVTISIFGLNLSLASQVMDMMPYILTVLVLLITAISAKNRSVGPASVGKSYFREDR